MERSRWIRVSGAALAGAAGLGALANRWANARWRRETGAALARLDTAPEGTGAGGADPGQAPEGLPAPVARYLRFALPERVRPIASAVIRWTGEFRMRPDAPWVPFTAVQHYRSRPPGFVWDARIRMMPLVAVRVRDVYAAEEASMTGRIAGLITVVDQGGSPELAASALTRWLGEAVWFPTALLPRAEAGGAVRWEGVDGDAARVTVTDGVRSANAEFRFGPEGEPLSMSALRYRDVEGRAVLTPFDGQYGGFQRSGGFTIPSEAEVAWLLPEGRFAYWRGRPTDVRYELEA